MRSIFQTLLRSASIVAALTVIGVSTTMAQDHSSRLDILEYDTGAAYTKFAIPAAGVEDGELTSPLIFELRVLPTDDICASSIVLNGKPLDIDWAPSIDPVKFHIQPTAQSLSIADTLGSSHLLRLSLTGLVDLTDTSSPKGHGGAQYVSVRIESVDSTATDLGFSLIADPLASRRLLGLGPINTSITRFDQLSESSMSALPVHDIVADEPALNDEDAYDIEAEIESLLLLEAKADDLSSTIAAKKLAIAKHLKTHRDHASLRHLLQQCDGLVCAAKVIAQRMCDKMGILTVPSVGYVKVQDYHLQSLIHLEDEKSEHASGREFLEKMSGSALVHGAHATAAIQSIRPVHPQSALLRVLGIIASVLGLTALLAFVRRKCMSARRRVERAADKEERRNARAYRRAARRAEMRRRWDAFVAAINCFGSQAEVRVEDYEEKRALILQDAFLEQSIDAAEKGEVMEAEIRELRHAHEIVSSLVGVDERRYDLGTSTNYPPLTRTPVQYTPGARSRASTGTLPSYTSEMLPDYQSRYTRTLDRSSNSSVRSGSVVASGSTRSNSVADDAAVPSPITSSEDGSCTATHHTPRGGFPRRGHGSHFSRYTPTSSVVETSPRPSGETIRTLWRRSADTDNL